MLVTGGAGFIGRWVVKKLLEDGHHVVAVDDFSNGRKENIAEFMNENGFKFIQGDIRREEILEDLFEDDYSTIYHLAAEINVQNSLDNPSETFQRDVVGTFNLLEKSRKNRIKFVFISSCMVYKKSFDDYGISEKHPVKPTSPYAAAKLSGEYLVLSYFCSYKLPTLILRPFNTYGPFQKAYGEGGVIAIFIRRALNNKKLQIFGNGNQTRDFLYVEDCVDFIVRAGSSREAIGQVINAGTGRDVSINKLASLITDNPQLIEHIPHIHPQSEIMKLKCDYSKALKLLNWKPKFELEEGIKITTNWIKKNPDL